VFHQVAFYSTSGEPPFNPDAASGKHRKNLEGLICLSGGNACQVTPSSLFLLGELINKYIQNSSK